MTMFDDDIDEELEEPAPAARVVDREWEELNWQDLAVCRSEGDPVLFVGPSDESLMERDAREGFVLDAFCSRCPVRAACVDFGRRHREFGVWGESEADRARAGCAPDAVTGRDLLKLRTIARLEREGLMAR